MNLQQQTNPCETWDDDLDKWDWFEPKIGQIVWLDGFGCLVEGGVLLFPHKDIKAKTP